MHFQQDFMKQMARQRHFRQSYTASKARKQRWQESQCKQPSRRAVVNGTEERSLYAELLMEQKSYWERYLKRQELLRSMAKWSTVSRRSHRQRLQERDLSSWIRATYTYSQLHGDT